jgi:hypothetical protein
MIRFRTLLCAASAACGLTLGINASAATLTLSIDACQTFSMTSDGVITCNTSGGTGPTASCSLTPTSPSVAIGVDKVLTMTCSNMAGAVTYSWTGCTSKAGNTCTVNLPNVTSVPVSVTAADGTNNISKGTTVTSFDPNAGGGGGGTIPTTCTSDGSKVVVGPTIRNFDSQPVFVGLPNKQTAVYPFVIPQSGNFQLRYFQSGDGSDATSRMAYVSKTPCDMINHRGSGAYDQQQIAFGTSTGGVIGQVDGQSKVVFGSQGNVIHGAPGETWYLMVQNKNAKSLDSCAIGTCALLITPSVSN